MINLIPPAAKKRVVTEYWVRTISLWSFLGGSTLLLLATLFVPLNLYVLNQESYLASLLAENQSDIQNFDQQNALLEDANKQAELLTQKEREYSLSTLLLLLQGLARERVSLTEVVLNQDTEPKVTLGGTALTRQTLVEFRDELEKQPDFLIVDLPISNLIAESDVSFAITVTLATSTAAI